MNKRQNSGKNIMVVDDSPAVLRMMGTALKDEGYEVIFAASGEKALARAGLISPDLILLDIMMSGMNGYETCRQLKQNKKIRNIPIIFMSALTETFDKVRAFRVGAADYIVKPVDPEELLSRVRTHLRIHGLQKELRRAKEVAEEARRAAESANRAKTRFLANMSHELRTPLNAILGFSQLMERDTTISPENRESLRIINRSGEHLLALIDDVLNISMIETGLSKLNKESFDLCLLLRSVEEMIRVRAEKKNFRFDFFCGDNVPAYVKTDERKLRQVLINLLGNAVKFTEKGGVALRVAGCGLKTEGEKDDTQNIQSVTRLRFEIEDTGPGIAPEEISRIFDPFVQSRTGQAAQEGTGLGLAISRKFVRMMGGDIRVESEPGKGSVFDFEICFDPPEMDKIKTVRDARRVVGLEAGQPACRILIVEDMKDNRIFLGRLIRSAGFEVREAANGREAVELFETWHPHLILMDMRMPVMDGYEASRRIRASLRGQAAAIIAVTASAFEEEKEAVLCAGCDDFVRKPFREREIFDAIAKHLGVRYLYEDHVPEKIHEDKDQTELASDALSGLPDDWIAAFRDAATRGKSEQVLEIIDRIRPDHAQVADALVTLVHNFRFDKIVALIPGDEKKDFTKGKVE